MVHIARLAILPGFETVSDQEVLFIWNSEACALVADISLRVPKLGGSFISATGDRIVEAADS